MSKTDAYKEKIKREREEREARKKLMEDVEDEKVPSPEANTNNNTNVNTNIEGGWSSGGSDRTKMVGLYFEPEVAAALNKLNKKKGRGYKSFIVNELVKNYLKQIEE
jgi:hypothetical protein